MSKYIPNTLKILLSFIPLFYTVGCCENPTSEKQVEHKPRTYTVLKIDKLPEGIEGTLGSYLAREKIGDRVSYNGISKVLCQLNPNSNAIMGSCQKLGDYDHISLRGGHSIRAPDYNNDGEIFGLEGTLDGVHQVL